MTNTFMFPRRKAILLEYRSSNFSTYTYWSAQKHIKILQNIPKHDLTRNIQRWNFIHYQILRHFHYVPTKITKCLQTTSKMFPTTENLEHIITNIATSVYLLRRTIQGMPICSAPAIPDWLPETSTQLKTGTPANSAPARCAATIFLKLENRKPQNTRSIYRVTKVRVLTNQTMLNCYINLQFTTKIPSPKSEVYVSKGSSLRLCLCDIHGMPS